MWFEFLDRGLSAALLLVSALLLALPLPARSARVAWSVVIALGLAAGLALNLQPANFPASNFAHYYLGAKFPMPYGDAYRLILAGQDRAPIGMRDLEHTEQIVRANTAEQRAYYIDLMRAAKVAFDPLAPLDSLAARARASGALGAELQRTLASALPANRIESFRRDVRTAGAMGQGERLTLDYGYNGSPFYGLLRQLDPTLHLPFGALVAWLGLFFQIAGLALVAFLAGLALGLTLEERLAVAALVAVSQDFAAYVLPGLVFTEVWVPVLLAVWAMRRGRPALAGLAIAVAGLLKLFPFLLVLPALVAIARTLGPDARAEGARETRRHALVLLGTCALATLALGFVSAASGRSWADFLHKVAAEFQSETSMINSVSVSAVLASLGVPDSSPLPRLYALISLVALALMFWRRPDAPASEAPARRALVLVAATGWLVRSWLNYYALAPFLLLPLLARKQHGVAVVMVLAMAGSYALPAIDDPLVVASGGLHLLKLAPYLLIPAWLVWLELRTIRWSPGLLRAAAGVGVALALVSGTEVWRSRAVSHFAEAGAAALDAGNATAALANYDHALRLSPGLASAHRRRAIALATMGRMDQALAGFARAVALAPGDAGAQDDYGRALGMSGRPEEAARRFERAHQLAPNDVQVTFELARARLEQGRRAEALALLRRARELRPEEAAITELLRQVGEP